MCLDPYVDQRLGLLKGHQVANVTLDDVPTLAKAITACIRGLGLALAVHVLEVPMVHLYGPGFSVYVRGEDWLKISPYLVDNTLSPQVVAYPPTVPGAPLNVGTLTTQDPNLYNKVYGLLSMLFPIPYPRTNI